MRSAAIPVNAGCDTSAGHSIVRSPGLSGAFTAWRATRSSSPTRRSSSGSLRGRVGFAPTDGCSTGPPGTGDRRQRRDGMVNGADRDADGDGRSSDADPSPLGWGIPDAFAAHRCAPCPRPPTAMATACGPPRRPLPLDARGGTPHADGPPTAAAPPDPPHDAVATRREAHDAGKAQIKANSATLDGRRLKLRSSRRSGHGSSSRSSPGSRSSPAPSGSRRRGPGLRLARSRSHRRQPEAAGHRAARQEDRPRAGRAELVVPPAQAPGDPAAPVPGDPGAPAPPTCTPGADTDGDTISDCRRSGLQLHVLPPCSAMHGHRQLLLVLAPGRAR